MPLTTLVGLLGLLLGGCSNAASPDVGQDARVEEPGEETPPLPGLHNDASIFALDPTYSVLPDGSVTELRNRDLGPLRARNGYFDAERRTIRLFGAQNQEVAVQLVVPVQGSRFSARAEGLEGVPADRVTFSAIAWSRVAETLLPDVIVPLDGSVAGLRTFDIPLTVAGLPDAGNRQGLLLMEVWIPKTASPGVHRGTVSVLADGKEIAKLGVDLTVFPLQLPDRPTFRMDYLSYGSPLRVWGLDADLGDGGSTDLKTTPEAIAAEQRAFGLALDNRGYLNVLPYASQRGTPFYGYPVQGTGRNAAIVSFDGFDRRFGPLLDGRIGKYRHAPAALYAAVQPELPVHEAKRPRTTVRVGAVQDHDPGAPRAGAATLGARGHLACHRPADARARGRQGVDAHGVRDLQQPEARHEQPEPVEPRRAR